MSGTGSPEKARTHLVLQRTPGGQLASGERDKALNMVVALIEAAARAGHIAPTTLELCAAVGIRDKTMDKFFHDLRGAGRISWRTVQGGKFGQCRVITVRASGLTTAMPEPTPPPPVKVKRAFHFSTKPLPVGFSDRTLYGPIEYAVKVLRRRGFVVFKDGAGVRVGAKLMQPWQVEQLAARERRLMASA